MKVNSVIFQVQEGLNLPAEDTTQTISTILSFLVQEGASTSVQNKEGRTPLQLCKPPMAALIESISTRSVHKFIVN